MIMIMIMIMMILIMIMIIIVIIGAATFAAREGSRDLHRARVIARDARSGLHRSGVGTTGVCEQKHSLRASLCLAVKQQKLFSRP